MYSIIIPVLSVTWSFRNNGAFMSNTKSRRGKCTWTPAHVVFSTGQLI